MEAGDYITAANSAVAGGAVAIAWWQARVAKQATDAQLAAQREQRDLARDERDKADCPRFIVQETDVRESEGDALEVIAVIKQTAGADLDEAKVTVHLNHEPAHVIGGSEDGTLLWLHTGPTAMRHLRLLAPAGLSGLLEIRADLVCREAGGIRTWTCRVFGYPQTEWEQIVRNTASPALPPPPPLTGPPGPASPDGLSTDAPDAGDSGDAEEPRGAPHPLAAADRRSQGLRFMLHWHTTLPRPGGGAHRPPVPQVLYPTLVHPEDAGLLAVTPVLTRTAGRSVPEDGIW
ncbi:hypothetical protein [Streptomyces sp. NPDC052114]|uniref:hypothetical protein n=1 Tax=unclassified Streptomyces TaxID=2593676 RepID=UPI0034298FCB